MRNRVFCASLADVFEGFDSMPRTSYQAVDEARHRLLRLIADTPCLDWLLLTKRPENVAEFVPNGLPVNVWLGVSVENQATADERIPHLLRTPAAVRFVSYEPALGPVDFSPYLRRRICSQCGQEWSARACGPTHALLAHDAGLHWVIVGGESGPHARPMHPDWARSARDQCQAAGVAFFFKQHGEYLYSYQCGERLSELTYPKNSVYTHHQFPDGMYVWRVGKKQAGRLLDGREWSEYPEVQP